MNVFGRPHWRTSQHFPITLTFIAGTNYRSTWHSMHTATQTEMTFFVVKSVCFTPMSQKTKGQWTQITTECQCEVGMWWWWMSLLQTEIEGKLMCLCTKSSMTVVAPLRMRAKCTTEHIQRSSTKSFCNTPESYWRLFQIESQCTPQHFISCVLCAQIGSWHI